MSFFQIIREARYSRALLDQLEELLEEKESPQLSASDAQDLLDVLHEGDVLTLTDLNTLRYVADHFPMDDEASQLIALFLEQQEVGVIDQRLEKVVKYDFGIAHLSMNIPPSDLEKLEKSSKDGLQLEEAFAEIMYAWFTDGLHPLSPYAVLMNYYRLYPGSVSGWDESLYGYIKAHLNEATVDVLKSEEWEAHGIDPAAFWGFRLTLHQFPNYRFFGFVSRSGQDSAFCRGAERQGDSAS